MAQEKGLENSDIILGKDISNVRRGLAFFSVSIFSIVTILWLEHLLNRQ